MLLTKRTGGLLLELLDAVADFAQLAQFGFGSLAALFPFVRRDGLIGGALRQLAVLFLGLFKVIGHRLERFVEVRPAILDVGVGLFGLPVAVESLDEVNHSELERRLRLERDGGG